MQQITTFRKRHNSQTFHFVSTDFRIVASEVSKSWC